MMEDMIVISNTNDEAFLNHLKRLEDIIPEGMTEELCNPLIQYIYKKGTVRRTLVDFFNHSDFLEQLTLESLLVSKKLYDMDAATEWYRIMQCIFDEKEDINGYCQLLPLCVKGNLDFDKVREMIETSGTADEMKIQVVQNVKNKLAKSKRQKKSEKSEDICKEITERNMILQNEKEQLAQQNEEFKCKIESLKRHIQSITQRMNQIYDTLLQSKREILKIKMENSRMQKQLKVQGSHEEEIAKITSENDRKENMIQRLNATVFEKNEENRRLIEENEKYCREIENYKQLIEQQRAGREILLKEETSREEQAIFEIPEEIPQEEQVIFEMPEETVSEEVFPNAEVVSFKSGLESSKKRSSWFFDLIVKHSEKAFQKNSMQDQENLIFIKMMEMHYSAELVQRVKKSISENTNCFELYKLICKNATMEELDNFFEVDDISKAG